MTTPMQFPLTALSRDNCTGNKRNLSKWMLAEVIRSHRISLYSNLQPLWLSAINLLMQ